MPGTRLFLQKRLDRMWPIAEFLIAAATFLLAVIGAGLVRLLIGRSAADRLMAVQLLGTGGGAICILLAVATDNSAIIDVALTLAILAAFAVAAFGLPSPRATKQGGEDADHAG